MTLSVQLYTMIAMLLMGIWVGVAVDTYGRLIHFNRWPWLLFLSDVLFWIVQALLIFYVLLHVNEGDIRFYIFIALLCGFAAYHALFQTLYKRLLETLIRFTVALIRFIKKFVTYVVILPCKWLLQLVMVIAVTVGKGLFTLIYFILKLVFLPLKWLIRLISPLFPDSMKNFFKKVAGFLQMMQNKMYKWFKRT